MTQVIQITQGDADATQLWQTVAMLARELGETSSWCLVGGLMVQLHAFEHGAATRPTRDIDLLADARRPPAETERVGELLDRLGATPADPPSTDRALGYRFSINGQTVDLLAPDGLKSPPATLDNRETVEIPGGTQALRRTEVVTILVPGAEPTQVRRPTLLGAILLKARALTVHRRPRDQAHDLITLLGFVEDPRLTRSELRRSEVGWLVEARANLEFDSPTFLDEFSEEALRRSRTALELLIAPVEDGRKRQ